jgi:CelD/BcsL family acetyltransferase involved in cellulose biosynthesis
VGKLRLAVLREIPEDERLRCGWNALATQVDQPQVFYTYEWALAVQRAYGSILRPLIFLSYNEDEALCGVAALATDPSYKTVSFLCATTGDYCDFLSAREHRGAFAESVMAELGRLNHKEIRLANVPADSDTVVSLRTASKLRRYHFFSRTAYICAQVSLAAVERRDDGKPVLPRKKMVRRFLNAMGREAPVRLEHARCWEQVAPVLPGFIQAHIARFLVTGRISNLVREERRLFLEELARLLSEQGWFALTSFSAGQQIFAWNYGFQFLNTWFWYQPTFDSDFEKYSPGFCLLAKLIEEADENPELQTVDLGLGAEDYKDRFANQTRETLYITLHASHLGHLRDRSRYYVAEALKKQPAVERLSRSALARFSNLKQRLQRSGFGETFRWVFHRTWDAISARDEVFFYELTQPDPAVPALNGLCLKLLNLNDLATAAVQNANDDDTLAYLVRCAQHLRAKDWKGFALVNHSGEFLHFIWAAPFESFYLSELNGSVKPPTPESLLLFDSRTPVLQRGKGYYAATIALVAREAGTEGRRSWIFSASTNKASVRALEKAGFKRDFSVIRYRVLWWQSLVQEKVAQSPLDVSARATSEY